MSAGGGLGEWASYSPLNQRQREYKINQVINLKQGNTISSLWVLDRVTCTNINSSHGMPPE